MHKQLILAKKKSIKKAKISKKEESEMQKDMKYRRQRNIKTTHGNKDVEKL